LEINRPKGRRKSKPVVLVNNPSRTSTEEKDPMSYTLSGFVPLRFVLLAPSHLPRLGLWTSATIPSRFERKQFCIGQHAETRREGKLTARCGSIFLSIDGFLRRPHASIMYLSFDCCL